jgi:hypothetical protein
MNRPVAADKGGGGECQTTVGILGLSNAEFDICVIDNHSAFCAIIPACGSHPAAHRNSFRGSVGRAIFGEKQRETAREQRSSRCSFRDKPLKAQDFRGKGDVVADNLRQ